MPVYEYIHSHENRKDEDNLKTYTKRKGYNEQPHTHPKDYYAATRQTYDTRKISKINY